MQTQCFDSDSVVHFSGIRMVPIWAAQFTRPHLCLILPRKEAGVTGLSLCSIRLALVTGQL